MLLHKCSCICTDCSFFLNCVVVIAEAFRGPNCALGNLFLAILRTPMRAVVSQGFGALVDVIHNRVMLMRDRRAHLSWVDGDLLLLEKSDIIVRLGTTDWALESSMATFRWITMSVTT